MAATKGRCVIVSASPDTDPEFVEALVNKDDFLVCADGGVDLIAKTSLRPSLVVGDFDSAKQRDVFPEAEIVTLLTRKIDTDTMHCADIALERGYRSFLLLGATGGRTDHALANLSVLLYLASKGAHGVISDRRNDISLLMPGVNEFHTEPGTTISVLPFGDKRAVLSYTGMSYPLDHGEVFAEYPYTISNEAVSADVTVTLHSGSALIFFIRE